MQDLMTIGQPLPTLAEIDAAPVQKLPALRAAIEKALAVRPTPSENEGFFFELIGRVPRCSAEMADPRVIAIQARLITERTAQFPLVVLRELLDRAEDEWAWRPTAKEVLDFARKIEAGHKRVIDTIDDRTRAHAAYAEQQAEREAMIAEHARQVLAHFGMEESAFRLAWDAAESDLSDYQRRDLRLAISKGQRWACDMLIILADAKAAWPQLPRDIEDWEARNLRDSLGYRLRDAFYHLKAGKPLDAPSECKGTKLFQPIEAAYVIINKGRARV
jgi:hypothetical protein